MDGCIILAAGSSSRMKQPKMLMDFNGTSFIQHIIQTAKQLPDTTIVVVTGCYHDLLQPVLINERVDIVYNDYWEKGMGSSISAGIRQLSQSSISNCFVLVCDQPYITATLLTNMLKQKKLTGKGIVACSYQDTFGTPVLFDQRYFNLLMQLDGPTGAKKMVQQFLDDTVMVDFPEGAADIDTPEDYQGLQKR